MSKFDEIHPDPFDVLRDEHRDGLRCLVKLGNAADSININGFSSKIFDQIVASVDFIDTKLRQHNQKEEMYLFPLIERHVANPTQVLRNEHNKLWIAFNELKKSVSEIEEGRIHESSIKELIRNSKSVAEQMCNHIAKEDDILFPVAKQLLSEEEQLQLCSELITMV
jgi:hemerythrin-like domain-containing protein